MIVLPTTGPYEPFLSLAINACLPMWAPTCTAATGARTGPGSGGSGDHVYGHLAWPGQRQGLAGLPPVTR
jgi:hypothetical protein